MFILRYFVFRSFFIERPGNGSEKMSHNWKHFKKNNHKIDSFFTNSKSAGQSTSTQSVTEPELSDLDHSDYVEPDVHEISPPKKKTQWLQW